MGEEITAKEAGLHKRGQIAIETGHGKRSKAYRRGQTRAETGHGERSKAAQKRPASSILVCIVPPKVRGI